MKIALEYSTVAAMMMVMMMVMVIIATIEHTVTLKP
jgi:hypothetical protein